MTAKTALTCIVSRLKPHQIALMCCCTYSTTSWRWAAAKICLCPLQVNNIFIYGTCSGVCWLYKTSATSWPLTFDLKSRVRFMCDMGYLCANFSLPRPLCSQVRPDVCDRRQTSITFASTLWVRRHNNTPLLTFWLEMYTVNTIFSILALALAYALACWTSEYTIKISKVKPWDFAWNFHKCWLHYCTSDNTLHTSYVEPRTLWIQSTFGTGAEASVEYIRTTAKVSRQFSTVAEMSKRHITTGVEVTAMFYYGKCYYPSEDGYSYRPGSLAILHRCRWLVYCRGSDGMELASRLSLGPCSEYWQFQIGFKDSSLRSSMGRLAH